MSTGNIVREITIEICEKEIDLEVDYDLEIDDLDNSDVSIWINSILYRNMKLDLKKTAIELLLETKKKILETNSEYLQDQINDGLYEQSLR